MPSKSFNVNLNTISNMIVIRECWKTPHWKLRTEIPESVFCINDETISEIFNRFQYSSIMYPTCHLYQEQTLLAENLLWFWKGSRVGMVKKWLLYNGSLGKALKQRKPLLRSLEALVFWKCGIDGNLRKLYFIVSAYSPANLFKIEDQ